ncbi:putative multicopper oxidase type 1 [Diplodia seriata]|uniref:Putative multicopper oxidase type 1 n=1 Tax=Diplodia seriata TaxID=420778 RepID=A0A0G2G355_9PEZI|nr:putative multicopper oxidase type 1 [Diplodia seriata]
MLWSVVLSLLLAVATAASKEPSLQLHDDTFVPDAVLRVTAEVASVGCIERYSVIVNGTVPGPPLSFVSGSVVWIRVYNDMAHENLTIHWHGLTQAAAPFADGSPAASQWPIAPLKFFDYELNLGDVGPGTYFYHSHVGFQAVTAAGSLIVTHKAGDSPPYAYDESRTVMFTDLFNTTDAEIEAGLTADPFRWTGEVGGVLINGHGVSQYSATRGDDASCSLARIAVDPAKTYRLRFIGAVALSFITLSIEDHNVTVIEADGAYTQPLEVPFVQVGGGQRYSALLNTSSCADLPAGRTQFYIQLETRDRPSGLTTYAVLDYGDACDSSLSARSAPDGRRWNSHRANDHGGGSGGINVGTNIGGDNNDRNNNNHDNNENNNNNKNSNTNTNNRNHPPISTKTPPQTPPLHLPPIVQGWLDDQLRPLYPRADFPSAAEVTRTVTLDIYQLTDGGRVRWAQNAISWTENVPRVPYLVALYTNNSQTLPSYGAAVASGTGRDARPGVEAFPARIGEVLEIVVQNTGGASGGVDVHPMHMHGAHYFYLGSGQGTYDRAANEKRLADRTPVTRDTTMLYRYADKEEPGKDHSWVAWRVRVEQPGVWMLHCHTLQHMIMGMQTVWVFGNSSDILTLPLPMVEGYLAYGGSVYGDDDNPPSVVHFFDADDDDDDEK